MDPSALEARFDAEGLLLRGGIALVGEERRARVALLTWLVEEGVGSAELRRAVDQDRLVLLPLERALRGDEDLVTLSEAALRAGLEVDTVTRLRSTLGLAMVGPDEPVVSAGEAAAYRQAALAVEVGLPLEGILEINGVLAASMPQLAATLRQLALTEMVTDDDELVAARQLAATARSLLPLLLPVLEFALQAHLEQQVVADFVETGLERDVQAVRSVAFADLTGFTALTESGRPGDTSAMSRRLTQLALEARDGRTRVVKSIGDAVMITAPTPAELVRTLVTLFRAAAADGLPALHAGLAHGESLQHAGDLFGRTVNLASRLADAAGPGQIVGERRAVDGLGELADLAVSEPEQVELKGIEEPVTVWRIEVAYPN